MKFLQDSRLNPYYDDPRFPPSSPLGSPDGVTTGMSTYSTLAYMQETMLRPMATASGMMNALVFKNPFNPLSYTPMGQQTSNILRTFEDAGKVFGTRELKIDSITTKEGKRVPVTRKVLLSKAYSEFVYHIPHVDKLENPVLFTPPDSGQKSGPLSEDHVKFFLSRGCPVVETIWKDPRNVPLKKGPFGLDRYVRNLSAAFDLLGDEYHAVVGCQAGTPLGMMLAWREKLGKTVPITSTFISCPHDTKAASTAITKYVDNTPIEIILNKREKVPAYCGYKGEGQLVFPAILQLAGFLGLAPEEHMKNFTALWAARMRGDERAVRKILSEYDKVFASQDIAGLLIEDILKRVFYDNLFASGREVCNGEAIDGSMVRNTAIYTVTSLDDKAVDSKQALAAKNIFPNAIANDALILESINHFGTFHGEAIPRIIGPAIREFQIKHESRRPKPDTSFRNQLAHIYAGIPNEGQRPYL